MSIDRTEGRCREGVAPERNGPRQSHRRQPRKRRPISGAETGSACTVPQRWPSRFSHPIRTRPRADLCSSPSLEDVRPAVSWVPRWYHADVSNFFTSTYKNVWTCTPFIIYKLASSTQRSAEAERLRGLQSDVRVEGFFVFGLNYLSFLDDAVLLGFRSTRKSKGERHVI
jgi:hypothetical protein